MKFPDLRIFCGLMLTAALAAAPGKGFASWLDPAISAKLGTMLSKSALGVIIARALPTKPLKKGSKDLKISPAYIVLDSSDLHGFKDEEETGFAGAASLTYGVSEHFGLSLLGGYTCATGDYTQEANYGGGIQSGTKNDKGGVFAASLIYDPFSKPDGFRLPMLMGLSFASASGKRGPINFTYQDTINIGDSGQVEGSYSWSGAGGLFGLAPQFNTGPVRWVFFLYAAMPFTKAEHKYIERDLTTGESDSITDKSSEVGCEGAGIEIIYRPWNISFTYVPPVLSDFESDAKLSVYSLTWTKRW